MDFSRQLVVSIAAESTGFPWTRYRDGARTAVAYSLANKVHTGSAVSDYHFKKETTSGDELGQGLVLPCRVSASESASVSVCVCSGHDDTDVGRRASISSSWSLPCYPHGCLLGGSICQDPTWVVHPFLLGRVRDHISHAMECCDGYGTPSEPRVTAIKCCSSLGALVSHFLIPRM